MHEKKAVVEAGVTPEDKEPGEKTANKQTREELDNSHVTRKLHKSFEDHMTHLKKGS